jgi:tricarboxylate carrier
MKITDPRTLLISDAELQKSQKMIEEYNRTRKIPSEGVEALWEAQSNVSAIIHPATGEKIFAPFRMSAFVPANVIIAAGLLIPGASTATQLFWQFTNQSYNTAMNYANRNGTDGAQTTSEVLTNFSYAVAVSSALSVGFRTAFEKASFLPESTRNFGKLFVPFLAVAGSNLANVVLMRRGELTHGIQVVDDEGTVRGKSAIAGRSGLMQVAISRVLIPVPVLTLPPIALHFLNKATIMKRYPVLSIPTNLALITACLYIGLGPAIALFPQIGTLPTSSLEPEFHNLVDSKGSRITQLYYNKGL